MQLHNFGRRTAAGSSSALKCGDDGGKSPFTEGRAVVGTIATSGNFNGTLPKFQGSADGGTTWTDLTTAANAALAAVAGSVYKQEITLPNQIRATATTVSAGHVDFYIEASGA